jgi:hypothetical protein
MKRKFTLYTLTVLIAALALIVLGEVLLRVASPTEYLSPRYRFSPEYGLMPFPGVRMVHGVPGKFKLVYTVNAQGHRGEAIDAAAADSLPRIVVLGDSYAFGMGVADGEEFAAVLGDSLDGAATVVNLGCPGWGLAQEIRRYYDFGAAYHPAGVVLQFCANDPADNFVYRVTGVENGDFVYRDVRGGTSWVKKHLSRSIVQRSQLYNFFRGRVFRLLERRAVSEEAARYQTGEAASDSMPPQDAFYCELLETYAAKLRAEGVGVVMIAVDGQLDRHPWIRRKVQELDARGDLVYLEVTDWLSGMEDYASVEGHVWGPRAHEVIGRRLAAHFRETVLQRRDVGRPQ